MMPEEWPITVQAPDRNARARAHADARLQTVRADFFLNPAERLTEQERALMSAMLHCLISDIADEIRTCLPPGWAAANDDDDFGLVAQLMSARLVDDPALVSLLLRRADEERISAAAKARRGPREARVIQGLVSHDDAETSAAAMALILAKGRRRDRFNECLVCFDDLRRSTWVRIVYAVAAALRRELSGSHGQAEADARLGAAALQLVARLDPAKSTDALTSAVVEHLERAEALNDDLLVAAARDGEVAFVAAALGHRANVAPDAAMDEMVSGDKRRIVMLLRTAGSSRSLAAGILASIGDLLGIADAGAAIALFDALTEKEVDAARVWLASDHWYRQALSVLDGAHG